MPKWTTSHTFIVIVGCAMAVLAYLAKDPATAPWAAPVLGVLTALLGYLGLTSGKAWGKGGPPGAAVLLLVACTTLTGTACSAQQWQAFEAGVTSFLSYVSTFLPLVQAIWTMILPTLGPKASDANAQFNKAVVDLTNADAVLVDAMHAADAVQAAPPNIAQLVQNVQDAVERIRAIVDQYSPAAAQMVGDQLDAMHSRALTIRRWR